MTQGIANLAVVILGALVAISSVSGLLRRRWLIEDWPAVGLVLAVSCSINLPNALASIFGGRQAVYEPSGDVYQVFSPWVRALRQGAVLLLLAALLVFVFRRLASGRGAQNLLPLVAAGACVLAAFSSAMHALPLGGAPAAAYIMVFCGLCWFPRSPGFGHGAALAVVVLVLTCALQAVISPDSAWRACRGDKCGPFGALYIGSFSNENELGLVLALGLVFVLLSTRGRHRLLTSAYVLFLLYATGSRTGELTGAAVLATFVLARGTRGVPRTFLSGAAIIGLSAAALFPFYGAYGPESFSTRGSLWATALVHATSNRWLGNGGTAWPQLVQTGEIFKAAEYSAHNEVLDTYYMLGLVGVVLLLLLMLGLWRQADGSYKLLILGPALVAGVLERPWALNHVDWLTWSLVAALGYDGRLRLPDRDGEGSAAHPGVVSNAQIGENGREPQNLTGALPKAVN